VTILSPLLAAAQQYCVSLTYSPLPVTTRIVDLASILGLFPIYLYVNFSGYTDVVIGAARFLRIALPETFNRPFSSQGYMESWSRWHMSLSNWFKTYVYSPLVLVLMRRFPSRNVEPFLAVFAYFVTFFLVGLWHGQTSQFVILGLLMGLGMSGNKMFQIQMQKRLGRAKYAALCANEIYGSASGALTFVWLAVTLVFFWASGSEMRHLVRDLGPASVASSAALLLLLAATAHWVIRFRGANIFESLRTGRAWPGAEYVRPAWYAAIATIAISAAVVLNAPAPHIVYKAF